MSRTRNITGSKSLLSEEHCERGIEVNADYISVKDEELLLSSVQDLLSSELRIISMRL